MNRILVALFALLGVVLGTLAFFQHADLALLRDKLAALERERDEAAKNAKASSDDLEKARADFASTKSFLEQKLADANKKSGSTLASADGADGKPGDAKSGGKDEGGLNGFAKMFDSEEGKSVMRSQTSMQVKMMYGGLAKDLKLDPATSTQVMQMIGERQSAIVEASMKAMGKSGAEFEAMTQKTEAIGKEWNEKLKAVLGDSGMTQLKEYERTLGDRMMLSMHEQTFNAAGAPLEGAQREGLLKVLLDERKNTPPSPLDGGGASEPAKAINAMKDDATVEKWLKGEEDYQRRVLQNATKVLSPDQIIALTDALKQQTDMQKLGVKMWRGVGKSGGGTPAAPVAK
jgi:hypothetical protein